MIYKRNGWYWVDFTENGRRHRRPLRTKNWQNARTEERNVVELARSGKLADSAAPKHLFEAVERYLSDKAVRCSTRTHELVTERLNMVKKFSSDFGGQSKTALDNCPKRQRQSARHCRTKNNTGSSRSPAVTLTGRPSTSPPCLQ